MMQTTNSKKTKSVRKHESEKRRVSTLGVDTNDLPTLDGLPLLTDQEWCGGYQHGAHELAEKGELGTYSHDLTALDEMFMNIGSMLTYYIDEEYVGLQPVITMKNGEITIAHEDGTIVTRLRTLRLFHHAFYAFPNPLVLPSDAPGANDIL